MISKNIIKQVLVDVRSEVEAYDVLPRNVSVADGFSYVFVGVRRAGKSFVLYQRMQLLLRSGYSWNDMLYVNFEDERLFGFDMLDFNTLLECHYELGGTDKPYLFLDEIQNVPNWEKFVRRMTDTKHIVWITGSNAKMLSKEIMTTLGGRFIPVEVYPFGFCEFLKANGVHFEAFDNLSTKEKSGVMRLYAEYFRWGGMPEIASASVKRGYLSSLYQKIYLGDICTRNNISGHNLLRLMIKKMAESVKQPVSYSRISKLLSSVGGRISVPTVSSYVQHCEDAWILLRLHNIRAAFVEKEVNCKYYFIDNGILNLLLVDANTSLLENLVAVELFRRYGNDPSNERFFFYSHNVEVDFYIPETLTAIQVSYSISDSDDTFRREVGALQKLPKVLECSRRLILTFDERGEVNDEFGKIEIVPCWQWLLQG